MKSILALLMLICAGNVLAQVKPARIFSDHVVFQRQKPIPVWGWAKPGEKVKVSLAGQQLETRATTNGKWLVKFSPLEAGGPYTLTVTAKSGSATVNDILIGEVWLCSGQSNMEWTVAAAKNYEEERKNAAYPQIRHFRVEHGVTMTPEQDLKAGEWQPASAETVGGFSAVGFFFAREIYEKLHIPVGLLHSSWGGSQIEGWISKEAMLTDPELKSYVETMPKTWEQADQVMDEKLRKQLFKKAGYIPNSEDEQAYTSGKADFSSWQKVADPIGQWDWKGLLGFRGQGYMAREVDIPAEWAGKSSVLTLPENDSPNTIYINGKVVHEGTQAGVRKISLPAGAWTAGTNQLVIKLGNMVAHTWFGPGLMGSASDLYVEDGTRRISLARDWYLMPSFAARHEYAHLMNNVGTTIYNAMIAPLIPFAIRGTLWYQGETNAGRAYQYRRTFPLMIREWRKAWNDEFFFYWVQLSSFGPETDSNKGSNWAELREAQNMTLSLPKTGMAVTTDIGNPKDIHPTNKQDVGHRLALNALKNDYGFNIACASPLYDKMQVDGSKAAITFKNADNGLIVKDRYGYLKGFEIAGEDKVFHFAKAEIDGNRVVVWNPAVTRPVAVRYAWANSPEEANLYSKDDIPASPFRTDDWPGTTVDVKFE